MLRGIPKCLSPELLKVICEMGHGDTIVIADAFYPSAGSARRNNSVLVRCDGVRNTEIVDAILQFMPLDASVEKPVLIMDLQECDRGKVETPVWDEYKASVRKYDKRGDDCVGMIERFAFYDAAKTAYAVVATGEVSLYGDIILQKGTI
ncbi:MAG: fucose isomerase [Christensenellaceae bacterium]|nr:fucose isomerase [Christensenellaceae bacterium]